VESGVKVIVLGQTVVEKLYGPSADPVGHVVRVKNVPFTVVGVLEKKGQSPMGQDYDDAVVVPVTTYQQKIQGGLGNFIPGAVMVGAVRQDATARAESQIRSLLRDRHRLQPGQDDDFSIRNLSEIASAQQEGTRTLTTLLAAIAAVSLLVGGIGIMNIMLVSVTERTREIGLRLSVGARDVDVLLQFLTEAMVLSLAGGAIGVGLGFAASQLMTRIMSWSTLVTIDAVLLSFGCAAAIGIFFGFYPARKAAKLDPIDALRYE
jgi:putative ABC transport system permease protein